MQDLNYWTSEEFIADLLKQLPVHVFWKSTDGVYLGCNNTFAEGIGLSSPKDIVGKTDFDLCTTREESEAYRADDRQVIESKVPKLNIEEQQTHADGRVITLLTNKVPLFDKYNNLVGILGVYFDISDRKKLEQYRLDKEKADKLAEYAKMAAGNIAHDLRTPLLSIKSIASGIEHVLPVLIDGYEKAKAHGLDVKPFKSSKLELLKNAVAKEISEIDFANHFIDMILGNLKHDDIDTSHYKVLQLSEVLKESLDAYPYQDNERELIHIDLKSDFTFIGDKFYFKNIINNLLKNAFYYIAAERKGQIFICTEQNTLHFKDTAKGASKEICHKIFTPYVSNREGGTGLGLAFCKTIMESFGGTISVRSTEGEYMEFILKFPEPKN